MSCLRSCCWVKALPTLSLPDLFIFCNCWRCSSTVTNSFKYYYYYIPVHLSILTYLATQWAAVSTHFSSMTDPPQELTAPKLLTIRTLTWKGIWPSSAGWPATIREPDWTETVRNQLINVNIFVLHLFCQGKQSWCVFLSKTQFENKTRLKTNMKLP